MRRGRRRGRLPLRRERYRSPLPRPLDSGDIRDRFALLCHLLRRRRRWTWCGQRTRRRKGQTAGFQNRLYRALLRWQGFRITRGFATQLWRPAGLADQGAGCGPSGGLNIDRRRTAGRRGSQMTTIKSKQMRERERESTESEEEIPNGFWERGSGVRRRRYRSDILTGECDDSGNAAARGGGRRDWGRDGRRGTG